MPPDTAPTPCHRLTWRSWVTLTLLFTGLGLFFLAHPEGKFRSGRAHGDGTYYYAYARSILFDRDLDLANDYRLVGNQFNLGVGPRGRVVNIFSIGPALFWTPFLAAGHGIATVATRAGWMEDARDGTSTFYHRVTFFGSLVWGCLALCLTLLLLRHYFSEGIALAATLGLALATPLPWYMTRQPCFSHAVDAFAVAALIFYWHRTLLRRRLHQWLLLGLLGGVAMLVRPQNLGFLLLPAGEGLVLLVGHLRRRQGRAALWVLLGGALTLAGAFVAFLPQMLVWNHFYGEWLTVPAGEDFLLLGDSKWLETLFASRGGLFAWHPLVYGGVLGLGLLLVPRVALAPRAHLLAALGLLAFAFQAYINGAARDWWGGWAFGGRRFSSCSILFALGLASLLWYLRAVLRRLGPTLLAAAPLLFIGLFALCNVSQIDDYTDGRAGYGVSQEMRGFWQRAATKGIDWLYDRAGNPGSIPASWIFAAHTGVSPARYDALSGEERLERPTELVSFAASPLILGGFAAEPGTFRGVRSRLMEGGAATLVLPLRQAHELRAALSLCPAQPGSSLSLEVNGRRVLSTTLRPGWNDYPFRIPADLLRAGMNYVVMLRRPPPHPGPLLFPVGSTGQELTRELRAESAGYTAGNHARFFLGGRTFSWPGRGLHAAVVEPPGSTLRHLGHFDTYADPAAAGRFARTVETLPPGTVVALAVSDEASRHWTRQADEALRQLGGQGTLLGRYRWSYALLGARGAAPGQALERASAQDAVRVDLGGGATGIACATLRLERVPAARSPSPPR